MDRRNQPVEDLLDKIGQLPIGTYLVFPNRSESGSCWEIHDHQTKAAGETLEEAVDNFLSLSRPVLRRSGNVIHLTRKFFRMAVRTNWQRSL
jgi:hypothetical protein